jgi:uncharacterized protein YegJ (DUF2314 family)
LTDVTEPPGYAIMKPGAPTPVFIEWFWMHALRTKGGGFVAELGNEPDTLRHVRFGETIHFSRQDIGDWMYFQNGKIVGNATACPALAHASSKERRQMKEKYGLDCGK